MATTMLTLHAGVYVSGGSIHVQVTRKLAHCLVALWASIASALYCTYVPLKTKSCILLEASLHNYTNASHHTYTPSV